MDPYLDYDEDLSQNTFFRRLQSEHKIILDTAPLESWVVCIPRLATLQEEYLSNANFVLSHILIPNDELLGTHFTSLLGEEIIMQNKTLRNKHGIECNILFEEIFYTKSLMKYKVWCINSPLFPYAHSQSETIGIFVIRDLNDAVELIRNETNSVTIFRRIENACRLFVSANAKRMKRLPKLRINVETLFSHCFQNAMLNRRLKEKCRLDIHFYKIFKIALETFMMNEIYGFLFDAITICCLEESEQFNKNIRNLSDSHLSRFNIHSKHNDVLTSMRMELLKIEDYTTAIEKLGCLRRALNVASNSKNNNLSMDEIIPIFVFVIIKSSLTHWISTFTFIRDFIFTDISDVSEKGADSFLITTLEAAITYIKTLNTNDGEIMNGSGNNNDDDSEMKYKFETKDDFMEHLLNEIRLENEEKVLKLLKTDQNVEIFMQLNGNSFESEAHFCHPLCDCENCELKCHAGRPNVNTQNHHGISALHGASMYGSSTMLILILALDANINIVDENNWSALHYAAAKGHQNTLLLLLHGGINMNSKTADQLSALHLGSLNGHQGCVKALLYYADHLKVHIDINSQNKMGDTPLHLAAKWGFTEIVEVLLENGANVECTNRMGYTALHYAHNSIITNLLQNSFVVIEKTHSSDCTTNDNENIETFRGHIRDELIHPRSPGKKKSNNDKIIAAIKNEDIKLAYHFLGVEAIPTNECDHHPLCNCDSCAPLFQSTSDSRTHSVSSSTILDLNEANTEGLTAIHAAAQIGDVSLMSFLFQRNASLHLKTLANETVLHVAVEHQHLEALKFILNETGEELINAQDSNGNTVLHIATEKSNAKLVDLLMRHEPNIDVRNNKGFTPLDIANSRMFFNIIQILNPKMESDDNQDRK